MADMNEGSQGDAWPGGSDFARRHEAVHGVPRPPRLLRLAPEDNICVVTGTVEPGQVLEFEGRQIRFAERVPTGHKVAIAAIARGERVKKYGVPIGSATQEIQPGQYVHTHNLQSDYLPTYTLDEGHGYQES